LLKLRVYLVDDHETVLEGLKAVVNAQPDMEVVGAAADGRMVLNDVRRLAPAVVVMDISMPHLNGLAVTTALHQEFPRIQIVALTRHAEYGYCQQMLRAGASGYVLKQSRVADLLEAIRAVAGGATFVDRSVVSPMTADFPERARPGTDVPPGRDLTSREDEVIRFVAWGYSNKEIAARLQLSVKTVETHKANAMHKLGMHTRIDVVRYGLVRGWLQDV
jgi:two-component system, NarL family, response regulator NreC